jgi:hypothetical protein
MLIYPDSFLITVFFNNAMTGTDPNNNNNTVYLKTVFFEDKIVYIIQSKKGLFVLRPAAALDFFSVFNLWA